MKDDTIYNFKEIKTKIKQENLIQLYNWLNENRLDWLETEQKRIAGDNTRRAYIVKYRSRYSLYVDKIA